MTITRRTLNKGLIAAAVQATFLLSRKTIAAMNVARSLGEGGESDATYEFEVATIKPTNPEGSPSSGVEIAGLEVTISSVPLHSLIDIAWGVAFWQIDTKGVEWITKDMYDVRAKAPDVKPGESYSPLHSWYSIQDPRLRKMLQSLLLDRFELKLHKEQRTAPVYLLRRSDRKKLTLVPADTGQNSVRRDYLSNTFGNVVGKGFSIYEMSMPGLAKTLSNFVYHHEVLDHTGLTGSYNFESKTILTEEDFRSQDLSSTFIAAVKEMGLEIEKTEGPTDVLVVDSASLPSPN